MRKLLMHSFAVLLTSTFVSNSFGDEPATARVANRPAVPGKLALHLRDRKETAGGTGLASGTQSRMARERTVEWDTVKTAIIVCDMWDNHYCQSAAQRVGVMVPKMNAVLTAARNHGVTIIHAPSGTVDMYANTPFRRRVQQAPAATPPVPIAKWCYLDPKSEPPLPIVDSKSPCDDAVVGAAVKVFSKQHPGLDITGFDGISDSGEEIFNFCEELGITNIALMGVHTNMCVLGRPFGIRQQVRLGRNVVLVRDLTDAMYDPREPPYVSHTRGTELVIEHIEAHWCPSILSDDLMKVVAGSADAVAKSAGSENQSKASRAP